MKRCPCASLPEKEISCLLQSKSQWQPTETGALSFHKCDKATLAGRAKKKRKTDLVSVRTYALAPYGHRCVERGMVTV